MPEGGIGGSTYGPFHRFTLLFGNALLCLKLG